MGITAESWLVGSQGLHYGGPSQPWRRLDARLYPVLSICRSPDALYVGTTGGLWEIRGTDWVQRHDETLTEVLAVCRVPGDPGVAAGCPYGVATATPSRHGAWRWTFYDQRLGPNERFTNCLLASPPESGRLIAGTEAGVLIFDLAHGRSYPTSLRGTPVRALIAGNGSLWAGTDTRGVWKSSDGECWTPAGLGLSEDAVFSLAAASPATLVAGTSRGIATGDGKRSWRIRGPRMLVSALAVGTGAWLAGSSPGGLWLSTDQGDTWAAVPGHAYVRALAAP